MLLRRRFVVPRREPRSGGEARSVPSRPPGERWNCSMVAVLLYAGLVRFTRNAARIFSIVSAIVLVASFVPDFTYVPTVPGSSDAQIAILLAMHVVAAAVIVRMLTTASLPRK